MTECFIWNIDLLSEGGVIGDEERRGGIFIREGHFFVGDGGGIKRHFGVYS